MAREKGAGRKTGRKDTLGREIYEFGGASKRAVTTRISGSTSTALSDFSTSTANSDREKIEALLPRGEALDHYYQSTERKHFGEEKAGSQFVGLSDLHELLEHTLETREGGLDGDDRDKFIALGCNPESFRDNYRYLMVEVDGTHGNSDSTRVSDDTVLTPIQKVIKKKGMDGIEGSEYRLSMDVEEKRKTTIGTILILKEVTEENLSPALWEEAQGTHNMLITAYPGTPGNFRGGVREENGKEWLEGKISRGEPITVKEVRENCFNGNDFGINLNVH